MTAAIDDVSPDVSKTTSASRSSMNARPSDERVGVEEEDERGRRVSL